MNPIWLARRLDNLKLRELEAKTGLNKTTISAIETGRLRPSKRQIMMLISGLPSYQKACEMLKVVGDKK